MIMEEISRKISSIIISMIMEEVSTKGGVLGWFAQSFTERILCTVILIENAILL